MGVGGERWSGRAPHRRREGVQQGKRQKTLAAVVVGVDAVDEEAVDLVPVLAFAVVLVLAVFPVGVVRIRRVVRRGRRRRREPRTRVRQQRSASKT